jgi:hypothetical protein
MSRQRFVLFFAPVAAALLMFPGCGDNKTDKTDKTKTTAKTGGGRHVHGPNDGHLLELKAAGGDHVHVEFVEDEKAKKLTAVLLDEDKKTEVQSSADKATLEVTTGGETKSFTLAAEAKDGKASRYSSAEEGLLAAVKPKDAKVKFQVELDEKTYTAEGTQIVH